MARQHGERHSSAKESEMERYYKIELKEVLVTSYQTSGHGCADIDHFDFGAQATREAGAANGQRWKVDGFNDNAPVQAVSFAFAKIEDQPYPEGPLGGLHVATGDIDVHKAFFMFDLM
jgi:type VI protein secretion system component Hcp